LLLHGLLALLGDFVAPAILLDQLIALQPPQGALRFRPVGLSDFCVPAQTRRNSAKDARGLSASACSARSSSHRDALVISSCAMSDRYSAIMVGISRPLVSLSSSCVTDRNKKLTGAKSGPRSLICQCNSTAMSSLVTVRLPFISATYEPPPRGCRLSSPAFFGG